MRGRQPSSRPTCKYAKDIQKAHFGPICVGEKGYTGWMCRCAKTGKVMQDAEFCTVSNLECLPHRDCREQKEEK